VNWVSKFGGICLKDFVSPEMALITAIICIFIIYFFYCKKLSYYADENWPKLETVIFIKNAQDEIEGIVNNFYSRQTQPAELLIVDCGSCDQTHEILERLARRYLGLKLLLLSDSPFNLCIQEALNHTNAPAVLLLDGKSLSSKEMLKSMDLVLKKMSK